MPAALPEAQRKQAIDLLTQGNLTVRQIAQMVGVGKSTVADWARAAMGERSTGPVVTRGDKVPDVPTSPELQTDIVRRMQQAASPEGVGSPGTGLLTGVAPDSVSALGGLPGDRKEGLAPGDLEHHDHPVLNRLYLEAMFRYTRLVTNGVARHHALAAVQNIDPDFYIEEKQHAALINALHHRSSTQSGQAVDPRSGARDAKHPSKPDFPTLLKMTDQRFLADAIVRFDLSEHRRPELLLMGWSAGTIQPPSYVTNIYDRYEMTAEQIAELADYLTQMNEDAYLLGLNQQLVANGLPHVTSITDPDVLKQLSDQASATADAMAEAYNKALANQTYAQWLELRSTLGTQSSTFHLDNAVGQWADQRAEWKAEQVAITESNRTFNGAIQDFLTNNPTAGVMARVTPDDCVCAGCQELVDAGDMPIEDALALQLPLHPGCVHEIVVTYDPAWTQSADVWSAQDEAA